MLCLYVLHKVFCGEHWSYCVCLMMSGSICNFAHTFFFCQVVIMDVEIKQTVGVIHVERNASPFLHLMPCCQRDVIYCLHENGCVSVRAQQAHQLPTTFPTSVFDAKVIFVKFVFWWL